MPINNNEDFNEVLRTFGDVSSRKPYSHVDLIVMIDGVDGDRGAITAGGRGYYLKGPAVFLQQVRGENWAVVGLYSVYAYIPISVSLCLRSHCSNCIV